MTSDFDPAQGIELTVEQVSELAPKIESGTWRLIDCREADEWAINRLPNARHIALSDFRPGAEAAAADGIPCIVYCHHGMRSLRAAAFLRSLGLDQAWSMSGGIDLWSDRIDPQVPKY
ncbi:hypothetical protein HAHE_40560 [Haloferula helveola]|uniref:Rhodanese domain-containing protein n=1 Tax=Haloferula helveola TaxID=490095 RepID=A0ABN6H9J3_9BACT|nr:hypothetical protein HAHE_40560 [Haloferula helveola]